MILKELSTFTRTVSIKYNNIKNLKDAEPSIGLLYPPPHTDTLDTEIILSMSVFLFTFSPCRIFAQCMSFLIYTSYPEHNIVYCPVPYVPNYIWLAENNIALSILFEI